MDLIGLARRMSDRIEGVKYLILWLFLSLLLGEFYNLAKSNLTFEPSISAALVTSFLAITFTAVYWRSFFKKDKSSIPLGWWLLGISPLLGAMVLSIVSQGQLKFGHVDILGYWPYILWIPVVEEVFYRGILSPWLKLRSTKLYGAYGASVIFTLMHADFTFRNFWDGNISVPLGPLVLAWCNEYILYKSGRLSLCIVFHISCNGSVIVFHLMDSRWLEWLDFLYL